MASQATSTGKNPTKLAILKVVHTLIYIVMAAATVYVFMASVSGRRDRLLLLAAGLVAFEGIVFFANGMRCPLTQLAQKYGDAGDTLFPEACTRYTFRAFSTLYALGVLLISARYVFGYHAN